MREPLREAGTAAMCALLVTVVAGAAVATGDAVVVALALAATLAVLGWATGQLSEGTEAGLGVADVAWAVALTVRGRTSPGRLLPLVAAQVVGALLGGALLALLGGRYAAVPAAALPGPGALAVLGLIVGLLGGTVAVLADARATDAVAGLGGAVSATVLPGAAAAAAHPAALAGLAVAGSLGWTDALVVGVTVLVGHGLSGLWCRAVLPA